MELKDQKCVKKIDAQYAFGKATDYCGKPATIVDTHGRPLCHKHYNQWLKKQNKLVNPS